MNFPPPILFARNTLSPYRYLFKKKKTHIYTFHKDSFTMQVLFYDNLTLNVSGIPMDQNKQQQRKFIHFLEPVFITSNTS